MSAKIVAASRGCWFLVLLSAASSLRICTNIVGVSCLWPAVRSASSIVTDRIIPLTSSRVGSILNTRLINIAQRVEMKGRNEGDGTDVLPRIENSHHTDRSEHGVIAGCLWLGCAAAVGQMANDVGQHQVLETQGRLTRPVKTAHPR